MTFEPLVPSDTKALGTFSILTLISNAPLVEEPLLCKLDARTLRDGNLLSNSSQARKPHVPLQKSSLWGRERTGCLHTRGELELAARSTCLRT